MKRPWQSHKANTVCNKESKSVLYGTLVVGTTTHGSAEKQNRSASKSTAIQQNQRLNSGSEETPLTAVDTLTALLRNSTKVLENLSQKVRSFKGKYRFKVVENLLQESLAARDSRVSRSGFFGMTEKKKSRHCEEQKSESFCLPAKFLKNLLIR